MFLEFYKLRDQPFGVTPDPSYLYLSPTHREALEALLCGIDASQRFQALIAEPGMGKTTLVFQLLEKLQDTSRTILLFQTQCDSRELVRYLLSNLGTDTTGLDLVGMLEKLNEVLVREMHEGRHVVLIIDEAQNLDSSVLETVWQLSNSEKPQARTLQIVLSGQPLLAAKLASPGLELLRQQLRNVGPLDRFGASETAQYIEHRLRVAGHVGPLLFTPDALQLIAAWSRGIPRNINNLCFNALAAGYSLGRKRIDAAIVEKALSRLDPEAPGRKRRPPPRPSMVFPQFSQPVATAASAFARRVLSTATLAALVATLMVAGLFALSSKRQVWRAATGGANSGVVSAAETPANSEALSPATELPSWQVDPPPGDTAPEEARSEPVTAPAEPDVPPTSLRPHIQARHRVVRKAPARDTFTIVVRPKDNLRQICLRYFGQYRSELVEEILRLNSGMTDPNQLAIGQHLRLPVRYRGAEASIRERISSRTETTEP